MIPCGYGQPESEVQEQMWPWNDLRKASIPTNRGRTGRAQEWGGGGRGEVSAWLAASALAPGVTLGCGRGARCAAANGAQEQARLPTRVCTLWHDWGGGVGEWPFGVQNSPTQLFFSPTPRSFSFCSRALLRTTGGLS